MKDAFWSNKKVVVSGANGFLASHVTLALLSKNAYVFGIIKEDTPHSFLNMALKKRSFKRLRLIRGDIVNYTFMRQIFLQTKPDVCFHLAAQASS